jgi:hypothetical protein
MPRFEDWEAIQPLLCGEPPSAGSHGELDAAINLLKQSTSAFDYCIFVTDDKKAEGLFFKELKACFPLISTMSSLDLVRALILSAARDSRIPPIKAEVFMKDAIASKGNAAARLMSAPRGHTFQDVLIKETEEHLGKLRRALPLLKL